MLFEVIEIGINRKPICDFLLVINTDILSRTISSCRSLLFKFWTLCIFQPPPPFGGLGTTYDVYLGLIGKRVVVLIELLLLVLQLRHYRRK